MNNIEQLFFELIRVAIGTQEILSRPPSGEEWKALYEMSKKQSLVGICFAGVQRLKETEDSSFLTLNSSLYLMWMGMTAKIQQRNEVLNGQCVELQKKLSKDGFRSYIMKGQANAVLYGDLQMLRQSGDIDVYLEGGLDKVLTYARTFGEVVKVNELEMSVPVFPDTEVEFHYRPFIMRNPWKNKALQRFFDSWAERNFENLVSLGDAGKICAPTMEFNLVHQLAHVHLHMFTEGIGMRQLMDYYFALRTSLDNDNENVICVVENLGLERFASALMWVIMSVFVGQECKDFYLWEPNKKDGELLLCEVMKTGNFGHEDENLKRKKQKKGYDLWALFFRNLKLWRFDHCDWFCGPLWRIYHRVWRQKKGYLVLKKTK